MDSGRGLSGGLQVGAAGRLGVLSREAQIVQDGAKEGGPTLKGTTPGPRLWSDLVWEGRRSLCSSHLRFNRAPVWLPLARWPPLQEALLAYV